MLSPEPQIPLSKPKQLVAAALGATAALVQTWKRTRRTTAVNPKRILVLEPYGLGDLISFEPVVRCLRESGHEVVLCGKPDWRELYPDCRGFKYLDILLPWATHEEREKYRLGSYLLRPWRESLQRLRSLGSSAIGLDPRGDIRSVLVLQWAGCHKVLSLSSYLGGSNVAVPAKAAELVPFTARLRRWQLNLRFLAPLGVSPSSFSPPSFHHLAEDVSPSTPRIGLMPVALWRGKLWLPERWAALAGSLQKLGLEVVGLCGPGQVEFAREQLGASVALVECPSVTSWATQLRRCTVLATLDSGPMHLADSLGVPVVGLFGQGLLPFWAPSGEHSRVLTRRDDSNFAVCQPIEINTPIGQKYMRRITVEDVLNTIQEILTQLQKRPAHR